MRWFRKREWGTEFLVGKKECKSVYLDDASGLDVLALNWLDVCWIDWPRHALLVFAVSVCIYTFCLHVVRRSFRFAVTV